MKNTRSFGILIEKVLNSGIDKWRLEIERGKYK